MPKPFSQSVAEAIYDDIGGLSESYASVIKEPSLAIKEKEKELREAGGYIHQYSPAPGILKDRSFIAVDGALASEQLVGGDLIVAGATIANALHSKPVYPEGFAEGKAVIAPHSSQNEQKTGGVLMKGLELRILRQVEADHTVIDGTYMGNASEILFALMNYDVKNPSNLLYELNEGDFLDEALTQILTPSRDAMDRYIAIPKSDSSYVQSKQIFGRDNVMSSRISDRMIASRMLEGGEFTVPRALETNPVLIDKFPNDLSPFPAEIRKMLEGKQELLRMLGGSWDKTFESRLYSLYFKPTEWSRINKAMKIEFISFHSDEKDLMKQARKVIQLVNDDVLDSSLMEPFCQFEVDRKAKEVKHAVKSSQQVLVNLAETDEDRYDLMYRYRT